VSDEIEKDDIAPESMPEISALDAYLDRLVGAEPREEPDVPVDPMIRAVAAQLRLTQDGVDDPDPVFIERLYQEVAARHVHQERSKVSRWRFLRGAGLAAAAAGLAGVGYEIDEEQRRLRQPHSLVTGPGRWYDIAAVDEVPHGQMKAFTAGGVSGYLLNDSGDLRAISAICTHMGCRLKPLKGALELRCLCHGSRFDAAGRVLSGIAPDPLPQIALRLEGGRVYAQGTEEDMST